MGRTKQPLEPCCCHIPPQDGSWTKKLADLSDLQFSLLPLAKSEELKAMAQHIPRQEVGAETSVEPEP